MLSTFPNTKIAEQFQDAIILMFIRFNHKSFRSADKRLQYDQMMAATSRNCFFSPIQCRLPVAEITPETMRNPSTERLRRQMPNSFPRFE